MSHHINHSINDQVTTIINHIRTEYAVEPEFLWPERFPTYSVFRHANNNKWFALVASIPSTSLGLEGGENNKSGNDNPGNEVNIINLKFDKNQTYDFAETSDHIFPAYHMNKNNWITVLLDGTIPNEFIYELIKKSYLLSDK